MSGLSYLCDYGNISSEDSDTECEVATKKVKLPAPDLSRVSVVPTEEHEDKPDLHGRRIRSFPHVRGNWATFVFVKHSHEDTLLQIIRELRNLVLSIDESCQICDDLHLSLSRTVVLKYHMIASFTAALQATLSHTDSLYLQLDSINVYCNDEKTRTFIAIEADHFARKSLRKISQKVDSVLEEFNLPPFYDDPSFHISILWVNGNKKKEFENILDPLNNILTKEIENNFEAVLIDTVHCKVGNKFYKFPLN